MQRRASYSLFTVLLVLMAATALAGCGSDSNKIGSTIKGTRIAIMDQTKTLSPDEAATGAQITVPEPTENHTWPQAGYDSAHVMPNAAIGMHLSEAWSAEIGEGSSSDYKLLARPVIKDGTIYTMDAVGMISALNIQKGNVVWTAVTAPKDSEDNAIAGGLGVDGETLYATTGFGEVLAFNAQTGAPKWRHALQNPIRAAPTIAGGHVYAVSIDNQLSALDADTGEVEWQHRGITESATLMGASNPAVVGDSVVIAYGSGEIYDLRAENGRVGWDYALTTPTQIGALPAIADIRGLPVIDNDRVFAISHSGRMAAIDHRTGDRLWEADIGGINTPVVAGNAVYILSNDKQLVALSRDTGAILWVQKMQDLTDPEDRDSDPLYWTGPIMAGGRLWLVDSKGQVIGFSPEDGKQTDKVYIGEPMFVTPVAADGMIFVVTDSGKLVALR